MTTSDAPRGLLMKYFVLKPAGTDAYAKASRAAMQAYADAVQITDPALAEDLQVWARQCQVAAEAEHMRTRGVATAARLRESEAAVRRTEVGNFLWWMFLGSAAAAIITFTLFLLGLHP